MGAKNVSACFAMWSHLDHAPFRLLVGMALVTLDDESDNGRPPRIFFGGQDALTDLLGRTRRSAFRALATLKKEGAVEVEEEGRNGHRAVYRLNLDPTARVTVSDTLQEATKGDGERHPASADDPARVTVSGTLKGDGERHSQGDAQRPRRVTVSDTPRNHGGTTEESRGGEHRRPAPQDRAREDVAADPDPSPEPTSATPAAPLSPTQMGEYETCSAALRARLGELQAVEAAMKYSDEHGCTITDAVIALAKVPA